MECYTKSCARPTVSSIPHKLKNSIQPLGSLCRQRFRRYFLAIYSCFQASISGFFFQGNKYFESRANNDPSRTKRTVQYDNPDDMWKYIGNGKRLPGISWFPVLFVYPT